jgi:hypothetical protein
MTSLIQAVLGLLVLVAGLVVAALLIYHQQWSFLAAIGCIAVGIIGMVWFDDRFGDSKFVKRFEATCYIVGVTFFAGLGASLLFDWLYS